MTLDALLGEFASRNRLETPRPDADRRYRLVADDELEIACFERFGQLCLVSRLGLVPEDPAGAAAWLRLLLNAALKRMLGSPSTPALGDDGAVVVFTRHPVADLAVQDLEALVEAHLNAHEAYRRAVAGLANARSPALPDRFAPTALRP